MIKKQQQEWIKFVRKSNFPTPFKLTDLDIARQKLKSFKKAMPNIEVYYAVKSCNDEKLISAIDDRVQGYDIASLGEFELLQGLDVEPQRILYSNPVKVPEHVEKTYKQGVRNYAFDSSEEIDKLAKYAPGSNVYLRLKVSDYGSKFPLSKKFGVEAHHAVSYMGHAQDKGLKAKGLAFHVGSQSESLHSWAIAFETCGEIISKLSKVGINIEFINIGGGFPVTYTERISSIDQIAKAINKSIKRHIPPNVKIVAEPGRYISAESSIIVTSIIGREHRAANEWLFLDMGVFQGLMEPLEIDTWRYPVFTPINEKKPAASATPYVLTGPTCDAYDTIGFDYMLPADLKVGDKIIVGVTGAYTNVYESKFNGFDPPKTYYIES